MITRKVDKNEHLAGFIYNWVKKIGENVDELRVISWQEGDSSGLPDNIKVFHLKTKQNRILKAINFLRLVNRNINDVNGVFCHQMPIYTILAAPIAKLKRVKIISWYAHGSINFQVKLMELLTDKVLTSSASGFRLKSKKIFIVGQGIDTEVFKPEKDKNFSSIIRLITVGRISPTKDYESMILAMEIISRNKEYNLKFDIIGAPALLTDKIYLENLKSMKEKLNLNNLVNFLGPIPNTEIVNQLNTSDIFINLSNTGSLDKAVLEAMASGCLVITANKAFEKILPEMFQTNLNDPKMLADKIINIISLSNQEKLGYQNAFRQEIIKSHNLNNLVRKIVTQFNEV